MTRPGPEALRAGSAVVAAVLLVGLLLRLDHGSVERGNRLYRAGNTAAAADVYRFQTGGGEPGAGIAYNLGTALLGLDPASADSALRRAADAGDGVTRQRSLYNLGYRLITASGDPLTRDSVEAILTEAVEVGRAALRLDPADQNARWNLAVAQRRLDAMMPPGEDTGRESGGTSEDEIAMREAELARSEDTPAESGLEPEDPRMADNSGERRGPLEGAREAWASQDPGPLTPTEALVLLANLGDEPEMLLRGILWSHRPDVAWWSGQSYPGGSW